MKPQFRLLTLLVVVLLFAGIFTFVSRYYRTVSAGVTSVYRNGNHHSSSPGMAEVVVLHNDLDQPLAVVVKYAGKLPMPTTTASFDESLKSQLKWRSSYPPDSVQSGVWIDEKKQSLGDLAVFYVSDSSKAKRFTIAAKDQSDLLADAHKGGDPVTFVKKWILSNRIKSDDTK